MGKMEYADLARIYTAHVNPSVPKLLKFMGITEPEVSAEGSYIVDGAGKRYLDCLGGYGVFSLGHRRKEVVDAVKDQLDKMPMSAKVFLQRPLAELAKLLCEVLPGNPDYSFVVNSGTEAVEGALKLARIFTGREKFISALNSFHGKTFGSLSATGRELFRAPFQPLLTGFSHVLFGDIDALEALVDERTAAVILEPIQGEGGIIVPPDGYLRQVKELCEAHGCLLICDEVQTGFGRTGTWFAVEHDGVVPDIIVTAKALGGGVMPVGAFSARAEVWEPYRKYPFLHTSTFGGNPLACVAACQTIKILQGEYEGYQVAEKGALFIERMRSLQGLYPEWIADVRGRGLMIGLEVRDEAVGGLLMAECLKRGLLLAYTLNQPKTLRLEPPFIIEKTEIHAAADILAEAFETIAKH